MYKKLAITTILFLLLSITVSFAWMMDVIGPSGDVITFDFTDSVFVEPNNLVIDISVEKDGEYVSACNNTFEENSLVQFNNCAPGDILKFSVKLTNLTDLAISTSILFSDITSSNEDFYNYISIGVFSTNGFDNMYKAPEFSDFKIISKMKKDDNGNIIIDDKNSFTFINELVIPPCGNEVEFKFFVKFDNTRENQNHLQNQTFTIGKINFMCI